MTNEFLECFTLMILLTELKEFARFQRLLNESGIGNVEDLIGLDKKSIKSIAKGTKGLTVTSLLSYIANCKLISQEDAPTIIHYIDQVSPYAAKYGTEKDEWGEEGWMTVIINQLHSLALYASQLF
jgi:hypothetical protein